MGKRNNYKKKYKPQAKKKFVSMRQPVTETKQREFFDQNSGNPEALQTAAATAVHPAATTVICPKAMCSAWTQGYGDNEMIGRKVFLKYLNVKVELDFTEYNRSIVFLQNTPSHADYLLARQANQFNFAFGWSKTDLSSLAPNTIIEANYAASVANELIKSGYGGKFLEFREKNRGIITLGKWKVRLHSANNEIGARVVNQVGTTNGPVSSYLPARDKIQYKLKFPIMGGAGIKAQTVPGATATQHFINRNYIPWVAISVPTLAGEHSITMPTVHSISKCWYSDS